jgi:hypothetical protein
VINWRIYYGDGSVYDDSYGKPEYAPKLNVQCIVVNEKGSKSYDAELELLDVGRLVLHDWEYYIYQEDTGWFGVSNLVDMVDHVLHSAHKIRCLLKARTLPTAEFKKIYKRAWNDPDFPPKSALRSDEAPQHFGDPNE